MMLPNITLTSLLRNIHSILLVNSFQLINILEEIYLIIEE